MSRVIASVFVPGRARTKGHIENFVTGRGSGKITVRNADRDVLKVWMRILIKTLREELGITVAKRRGPDGKLAVVRTDGESYAGPVRVDAEFRFEQVEGWDSHDTEWPTGILIGDVDTLWRAVLDGLTQAGVLDDDRWVVGGTPSKRWALADEQQGVQITVTAL